jgi:hypothetical protein
MIMKAQEEILQCLNMMQKKSKKDFGTKKVTSARQETTSKSQRKRDDCGNDMNSRCRRRIHHSPDQYTRRDHSSSGLWNSLSVSPIRRHRRMHKGDIFQGELMNIKTPTFNVENKKGEEAKNWMLEMKKYF